MKHKWHIRRRLLATLTGLTCVILLAVALAFNLTMRGYIQSRVSAQLTAITDNASRARRGDKPLPPNGEIPDGQFDGQFEEQLEAQSAEQPDGQSEEQFEAQSGEQPDGQSYEQFDGQSVEQSGGQSAVQPDGQSYEQSEAQSAVQPDGQSYEQFEAQSAVQPDGRFDEQFTEQFDGRPDRITGTEGSVILLDGNGHLLSVLHGDSTTAENLAESFRESDMKSNDITKIGDYTYAVSVVSDPVENGQYLLAYVDVTSLTALTDQINLMFLLVILAAIVLSILLSRRFARSFAEPVQELSSFAEEIGTGNLTQREFMFRDVEFDTLASSMNRMVSELKQSRQKQETFFQNVSHELRTPLTSIRGNAEGIVYGIIDPKSAGKVILSESDKLGGMVEDILYLSRMGKSAPESEADPLDLREVLSLCVSEQRAEAEKRGIGFGFDFDEEPVLMQIREQDAQRLFSNLISNAIRYAESEVRLTCRNEEHKVMVSIADDGPGISEEDMPHIFERFYRGKGGKHGIGLAIAQSVTENCHGTISVRNDNGAVFEVSFPR